MRIFLTGATGFIGGHVLRALVDRGHQVTCLARSAGRRKLDALDHAGVTTIEGEFTAPETWVDRVAGHEAIVNAVGIIRETGGSRFDDVHTRAPIALFEAAASHGVRKVVQISALGADEAARSRYHLSKRAADRRLAELGIPYVVLRPSIVYGPGDASMTMFLSLAALPIAPVPGDGQYQVQPVYIDDLVKAVVRSVESDDLTGVAVDVGGGEPVAFDRLIELLARRLGKDRARILHVPWPLLSFAAALTDAVGRGPISRDELAMLRRGNTCDTRPFRELFGFEPLRLDVGLARRPLTLADHWKALLTHLRVPLRLSIAFIWFATGLVSATVSADEGFRLLDEIGIRGMPANVALYGTSLAEIATALATAVGWRIRWMGAAQIALMIGFLAILTVGMPELWLHPFGPLTKNVPLIAATLVMMVLEDH